MMDVALVGPVRVARGVVLAVELEKWSSSLIWCFHPSDPTYELL